MTTPTCPTCQAPLICPHCTGQAGGKSTSPAKQAAARANGRKGGAPVRIHRLTLRGIGTVLADTRDSTLTPSTHVVAQRLGVGYHADNTAELERQRTHRRAIEDLAYALADSPESWAWRDPA